MPSAQRLDLERLGGAQQAEAGVVVVADHIGGGLAAGIGENFGGMRLDHQIADGEDQALVVDDDAGAGALLAETFDRAPLGIDVGLDLHHRREQLIGGDVRRRVLRSSLRARDQRERSGDKNPAAPGRGAMIFATNDPHQGKPCLRANPSKPHLNAEGWLPPAARAAAGGQLVERMSSSYGSSEAEYAESAIMSSIVSFSTTAFISAIASPLRRPCCMS